MSQTTLSENKLALSQWCRRWKLEIVLFRDRDLHQGPVAPGQKFVNHKASLMDLSENRTRFVGGLLKPLSGTFRLEEMRCVEELYHFVSSADAVQPLALVEKLNYESSWHQFLRRILAVDTIVSKARNHSGLDPGQS